MLSESFVSALRVVEVQLRGVGISWAVIASTNLALQGMVVVPRDVDVVVEVSQLERVRELFAEFSPSPVKKLNVSTSESAWSVTCTINDVVVEFLGERITGYYVSKLLGGKIKYVQIERVRLPCLLLKDEAEIYASTNKPHKTKMILEFLKKC